MTAPVSLLVGSDTLGWQEFGGVAQLGPMTRAMPGGDGSLEFTIPGPEAGKRRNVLQAGAEVILDTGDDQWSGLIVGDPMAGYYSAQPLVSVAAAGMWSHAANRRDVAYVWCDSDPTQWFRIRQKYDGGGGPDDYLVNLPDQGKFTTDTEGRLYIRADADRTFAAYSLAPLCYWLGQGVADSGCRIVGLDIVYKADLSDEWEVDLYGSLYNPWRNLSQLNLEWSDTSSESAWTAVTEIDLADDAVSLVMQLLLNKAGTWSAGGSDPYVRIKSVVVRCRMDGATVDRSVTLDKALCDLATLTGLATVIRSQTLGTARDQLVIRPEFEKSVADGLVELAALHDVPVEHYFDRSGGAWRFTCNEVPAAVDPTRNRHWVLDDSRAGEDTSGVVRDPEVAPEYLRILFLSSGVADLPDGQPRSYCYPSEPTDFVANVAVDTAAAEVKLTDAEATAMAARMLTQMSAASFAGEALTGPTAITVSGQELPSRLVRPGDRVNILGREGATDLYVSETNYDWGSGQMGVTVGWPFEVTGGRSAAYFPGRHGFGHSERQDERRRG